MPTLDQKYNLGLALAAANAADEAFQAAIVAAGIVSRWDLRGLPSDYPPAVRASYYAKVAADEFVHAAFVQSRGD